MATQMWRLLGTVLVCLTGTVNWISLQAQERFAFTEPHLGTIVEITLYAPEERVANQAAKAAFQRIRELDQIFSDYKSDSEVMRLCLQAGEPDAVAVSPELFGLLTRSMEISSQTDGAFDVTVGPLIQLWRRSRKQKELPAPAAIATAKTIVGRELVELDEGRRSVRLTRPGMRLDFGGIAKGYIAQDLSRVLREQGVPQSLVAVAGDIVAADPPPGATHWKIGVAPLDRPNGAVSRLLALKNCAVSTSGDAFQFVEIGGRRYSHIVDPRTGIGLTQRSSVTVVAQDGATADALATAVCVLGPQRGLRLIDDQPQTAALVVVATEDGPQVTESKAFSAWEIR